MIVIFSYIHSVIQASEQWFCSSIILSVSEISLERPFAFLLAILFWRLINLYSVNPLHSSWEKLSHLLLVLLVGVVFSSLKFVLTKIVLPLLEILFHGRGRNLHLILFSEAVMDGQGTCFQSGYLGAASSIHPSISLLYFMMLAVIACVVILQVNSCYRWLFLSPHSELLNDHLTLMLLQFALQIS